MFACFQLWRLINDGIKSGVVQPLPTHVYEKEEAESAFRFMANDEHVGKVLIKVTL